MSREKGWLLATWLAVVTAGIFTYLQFRGELFYDDANEYALAARSLVHNGILNRWQGSDIRTYGYPLYLAGAFKLTDWMHISSTSGLFVVQWPCYVGSSWLAARCLFQSHSSRLVAFALLAANPLLVVYTAFALTESVSLSLLLLAVAALGRAARSQRPQSTFAWLVAGAVASSFDMVVRPGNLVMPVCYAIAAVGLLLRMSSQPRRGVLIGAVVLVLAGLAGPLIPQMLINQRNYHKITPLPVYDLTALQTKEGLEYIRYATNVSSECGVGALYFLNPLKPSPNMSTSEALLYYTTSWPGGPETASLHIFSALDPRPFLTYQDDFGAGYERWLQALTIALLFLACFGAPTALAKLRASDGRLRFDAGFLGLVALLSVGIIAASAAEYRYGVIPIATVSLLASAGIAGIRRPTMRVACFVGIGFASTLLLWITLSDLVLATSDTWRQCS